MDIFCPVFSDKCPLFWAFFDLSNNQFRKKCRLLLDKSPLFWLLTVLLNLSKETSKFPSSSIGLCNTKAEVTLVDVRSAQCQKRRFSVMTLFFSFDKYSEQNRL